MRCTGSQGRGDPGWRASEILSSSTERVDRSRKLRVYAREGVGHLWLLDPLVRTLEVLRLESGRWVLLDTHADTDVMRADPFEAIEIGLRRRGLGSTSSAGIGLTRR